MEKSTREPSTMDKDTWVNTFIMIKVIIRECSKTMFPMEQALLFGQTTQNLKAIGKMESKKAEVCKYSQMERS